MRLRFHTLDVFTARRYAGNPLAVVLDADALSQDAMQAIAREFNLSETVFLQKPARADALVRARIFTPAQELPFAGHPTVGTACLLAELGIAPAGADVRFVLEEGVGPVPVRVRREAGRPPFGQLSVAKLPESGPAPPAAECAAVLGLDAREIGAPGPRAVSCGLPFVLLPLTSVAALQRAQIDVSRHARSFAGAWAQQLYLYARDGDVLRCRMFAPGVGVVEDPATGSAAAALAGALAAESKQIDGTLKWTLHQGVEMGRPSVLETEADLHAGGVRAVRVGGHAVKVTEGELNPP